MLVVNVTQPYWSAGRQQDGCRPRKTLLRLHLPTKHGHFEFNGWLRNTSKYRLPSSIHPVFLKKTCQPYTHLSFMINHWRKAGRKMEGKSGDDNSRRWPGRTHSGNSAIQTKTVMGGVVKDLFNFPWRKKSLISSVDGWVSTNKVKKMSGNDAYHHWIVLSRFSSQVKETLNIILYCPISTYNSLFGKHAVVFVNK